MTNVRIHDNKFVLPPIVETKAFATQWGVAHDANPEGQNPAFGWYTNSRLDAGNTNPNCLAFVGWGQYFNVNNGPASTDRVMIRNFSTLLCYGTNRLWNRFGDFSIDGQEYTDYSTNTAQAATLFSQARNESITRIEDNHAFHFWNKSGRFLLPEGTLNGILVCMQVKAVPSSGTSITPNAFLAGCGADYWTTMEATWQSDFSTNPGVGVGKLSYVTDDWTWIGISTCNDDDIDALYVKTW